MPGPSARCVVSACWLALLGGCYAGMNTHWTYDRKFDDVIELDEGSTLRVRQLGGNLAIDITLQPGSTFQLTAQQARLSCDGKPAPPVPLQGVGLRQRPFRNSGEERPEDFAHDGEPVTLALSRNGQYNLWLSLNACKGRVARTVLRLPDGRFNDRPVDLPDYEYTVTTTGEFTVQELW